jgi:hypothetical protein
MLVEWRLFIRSKNKYPVNDPKSNVSFYLKWTTLNAKGRRQTGTDELQEDYTTQLRALFTNAQEVIAALEEFSQ